MIILPYGDSALLVNFEQRIDEDINQRVIGLQKILESQEGVTFTIPAYCSLTIGFDAAIINAAQLTELIQHQEQTSSDRQLGTTYTVPVCYEGDFAPDMQEVCELTGLAKEEIIRLHTSTAYRVFMLGFIAGFAYLGKLPEALQCPRKQTPRKVVPQGAVGLAGFQTGIYPADAPGGWQLIGQTPLKTFQPHEKIPVKLQPGDKVQFRAVTEAEYESIRDSVQFGTYEWEVQNG